MSAQPSSTRGPATGRDPGLDDLLVGAVALEEVPAVAARVASQARRAGREGAARLAEVLALDARARTEGPAGVADVVSGHLAWAADSGDDRLACHCHAALAMVDVMLGHPGPAAEHATTAVGLLTGDEPPRVVLRLLTRQAVGLFVSGLVDLGFDVTTRAVRLAEDLEALEPVAQLAANAVQAAVEHRRTTEAELWSATLLRVLERSPQTRDEMADVLVRGLLSGGRPDLALHELDRAEARGHRHVGADGEAVWLLLRARAERGLGRLDAAKVSVARAAELAEAASQVELATALLEEEAALAAAAGDFRLAYEHHRRFHEEERARWSEASSGRVAELLAQQRLADAVRRADRAEDASKHDALTGLWGRRWVQEELPRIVRSRARSDRPVGLAIVDLDHFKLVNDRHGHDVGDEVLSDIARRLQDSAAVAHAARLGGEEFLLVLATPPATWREVLDDVRRDVSALTWPRSAPGLTMTASIGVAQADATTSLQDAMRRADRRLYRAKTGGRDRTVGPWQAKATGSA
jgi:diguanylate cyclase (GGDEF)-like protein